MTRRWTMVCLVLLTSFATTMNSVAVTGLPALADDGNGKKEKDKDKEKEKKDKERRNGKDAVEPAAPYRMEVICAPDEGAGQTECSFKGIAPAGSKKVGHVDVPVANICTTVLGGNAEFVDPDPNTGVVGYKSRGSEGAISLILAGEVTTSGTATYWVKAGNNVFPATGLGLICTPASPSGETVSAEVNLTGTLATPAGADASPTGGTVAVHTYACAAGIDPATIDWFGTCQPGVSGVRFTLSTADIAQSESISDGATEPNGEIRFDDLPPGTYQLDAPDDIWCHAESDNVNDRGELVVTPGAEVSVWIFLCGPEAVT